MENLFDPIALAVLIPVVCLSTFVFVTVGFGGGVVAVPIAFLFLPPTFALPVLAVIEACTMGYLLTKHHHNAVRSEVVRIIPASVIGTVLGVWVLVNLPVSWLMLGMSAFIVLFLVSRGVSTQSESPVSQHWAAPSGLLAGFCSGAFGAGGPPSAVYFTLRNFTVDQLRSSIATTGSANLIFRITGFAIAGLFASPTVFVTALCLLPFAAATAWAASKARSAMSQQSLVWATYAILVFSAISLAIRSQTVA